MPFIDTNYPFQSWRYDNTLGGVVRNSVLGLRFINNVISGTESNIGSIKSFKGFYKSNKNYQFLTRLTGSGIENSSIVIRLSSPFSSGIVSNTRTGINTTGGVMFYNYAVPTLTQQSNNIIKYGATHSFTMSAIKSSRLNEIDFLINGYREFSYLAVPSSDSTQPNGWCYEEASSSYVWYNTSTSSVSPIYSTFGSGLEQILARNYIAKLIEYDVFTLDFNFNVSSTNVLDNVKMYLVQEDKLKMGINQWGTEIKILDSNLSFNRSNLSGLNLNGLRNYLVFSADISDRNFTATISDIRIVGGYSDYNNVQNLTTSTINTLDVSIPDVAYKYISSNNGVTYSLSSKIGNGEFKSGIWENGVWNNGWRDDTQARDFDDVYSAVLYSFDISWQIKIKGPYESCKDFQKGDKVSIGNIVAIDINENRKLIKDYYTISATGSDTSTIQDGLGNTNTTTIHWIQVNLDTTFLYRRIEKDSPNHKIKITKNVWLSGGFFNGYFSGVWNNGLFKGYPKITEMYNTFWIDGIFNGGHFNSNYPSFDFIDIISSCDAPNKGKIKLVFSTQSSIPNGHDFIESDYLFVTLNDNTINPSYEGIVKVLSIENNNVIIDKIYSTTPISCNGVTMSQSGKAIKYNATGLIQDFKFYDTNVSKIKSIDSKLSTAVFKFNSWIDVNYDETRAVTIGRDFRSYEPLTGKSLSRNNLYGYPTYDILSSASRFRNSFDLNFGLYKLGTKYKIFSDPIGPASEFREPFSAVNFKPFYDVGWTYAVVNKLDLNIDRTETILSFNDATSLKYISSGVTGEELWTESTGFGMLLNNDNINVSKSRYSVIELDVITYSVNDYNYTYTNYPIGNIGITPSTPNVKFPVLHFSNLNYEVTSYVLQKADYGDDYNSLDYNKTPVIARVYNEMSFLPISTNINHLQVSNSFRFDSIEYTSPERYNGFGKNQKTKKYEYFYNKTDLMMSYNGNGATGASTSMGVFDNVKMYEVDMIPFFKYFEEPNINKNIQIPYEGYSPDINYFDSDFNFVDNISVGLDTTSETNFTDSLNCVTVLATASCINVSVETKIPNGSGFTYTTGGIITIDPADTLIYARGVCWGTSSLPTIASDYYSNDTGGLSYNSLVSGLLSGFAYYVRAYVITSIGISYGTASIIPAFGLPAPPVVVTNTLNLTSLQLISVSNFDFVFNSNFVFTTLRAQVRPIGSTTWATETTFTGITSPQSRIVSLGSSFEARIIAYDFTQDIFSNTLKYDLYNYIVFGALVDSFSNIGSYIQSIPTKIVSSSVGSSYTWTQVVVALPGHGFNIDSVNSMQITNSMQISNNALNISISSTILTGTDLGGGIYDSISITFIDSNFLGSNGSTLIEIDCTLAITLNSMTWSYANPSTQGGYMYIKKNNSSGAIIVNKTVSSSGNFIPINNDIIYITVFLPKKNFYTQETTITVTEYIDSNTVNDTFNVTDSGTGPSQCDLTFTYNSVYFYDIQITADRYLT